MRSGKSKARRDQSHQAAGEYQRGGGWTATTNLGPVTTGAASLLPKPMTREEQVIVRDSEDEFKRRGHFKRIFPSLEYHYYKQFFLQGERPLNKLLDDRIMEKRRLKTAALIQMQNRQNIQHANQMNLQKIANQNQKLK